MRATRQPSARELLERYFHTAISADAESFGQLFACDGALEVPLAKLRFTGPAAIADRARVAWHTSPLVPSRFELCELIESPTGITAEYVVHGTSRDSAQAFSVSAIVVIEAVEGAIISMREYLQPIASRVAVSAAAHELAA